MLCSLKKLRKQPKKKEIVTPIRRMTLPKFDDIIPELSLVRARSHTVTANFAPLRFNRLLGYKRSRFREETYQKLMKGTVEYEESKARAKRLKMFH